MSYNYRHLYYFWVVAKEGSMSKAAIRLDMAVQTISTQVHELEKDLGHLLFKPEGRGLVLTEAGLAAVKVADQIFSLGEKLPHLISDAVQTPKNRITLGVSDGLPKLATLDLLKEILQTPHIQLVCHEGNFEDLLADLALHRLDLVLADRAAPNNKNLNLRSKALGQSPMSWYAPKSIAEQAKKSFPQCLAELPVLLPTDDASNRIKINQWFEKNNLNPNLVGEFEDSALLATFGASGLGIFPAAELLQNDLSRYYDVEKIGYCEEVYESFFGIYTEKKAQHPLVKTILASHPR